MAFAYYYDLVKLADFVLSVRNRAKVDIYDKNSSPSTL